jgi:hypothetical protein
MVAALGGCLSVDHGPEMSGPVGPVPMGCGGCGGGGPPPVPGLQGPWGQQVAAMAPYNAPMSARQAAWMMSQSVPLDSVQLTRAAKPGSPSGVVQAGANVPAGPMPGMAMPPGGLLSPPGMGAMPVAPGMGGPGPMPPMGQMMAAAGPLPPPGAMPVGPPQNFHACRTQVRFVRPSGMKVSWFSMGPGGPSYSTAPIETPGRYNFAQAAVYRLKLSGIEGRPGLEVYPTLEVVPANPKTEAFLAHSSVPVEFTNEDFQQIAEGNYVVKVIYLPDPAFQELAATGTDEIVSTRLEPGADPIKEALRRGSILLVIRMGNMDQEAPNTPPIDAPAHGAPHGMPMVGPGIPPAPFGPGMPGPGPMLPYTGVPGPSGPAMGPMGPMPPGGPMGPMPPMGGPMGGHPVSVPPGMGWVPPAPTPAQPAPAAPPQKQAAAGAAPQVGAAASPLPPSPPAANTPPTPASLLAIQDSGAAKR